MSGKKSKHDNAIGVTVSMDVSAGSEEERRIFGRVYEVQEDPEDPTGVTYLAVEESRNFAEAKPLVACRCFDDVSRKYCKMKDQCSRIEAYHTVAGEN